MCADFALFGTMLLDVPWRMDSQVIPNKVPYELDARMQDWLLSMWGKKLSSTIKFKYVFYICTWHCVLLRFSQLLNWPLSLKKLYVAILLRTTYLSHCRFCFSCPVCVRIFDVCCCIIDVWHVDVVCMCICICVSCSFNRLQLFSKWNMRLKWQTFDSKSASSHFPDQLSIGCFSLRTDM